MNKAYDPLDLFSAKECIAFHLEIFVTCGIFLREQTVNTLGKRLGNETKQLYFTQLCFISFQKALCGPLPKGHCLKTVRAYRSSIGCQRPAPAQGMVFAVRQTGLRSQPRNTAM